MLGLAIGVVHPDPYKCTSHHEVAELAAMAKKEAKKLPGSALFVSRRRKIGYPPGGDTTDARRVEDSRAMPGMQPGTDTTYNPDQLN